MNGSSCPRCGWVLRWLQEQGAWGCDRCRMVVPPQQVAPPQQQMTPHAPPPGSPYAPQAGPGPGPYSPHAAPGPGPGPGYPLPAPRPRSSKGLVIGLSLGAIAVAGTVAGILLTRGGGSGVGSGDELVKQTLAAVSEGNVEKLVKLSDPVGLYERTLDCSERDKAAEGEDKGAGDAADDADTDADDPQIQEKRLRRKHEKLVEKLSGTKLELVSIEAEKKDADPGKGKDEGKGEGKGGSMKKGDKAMKGCVFKVDVELHTLVAKLRITEPDAKAPADGEAQLMAVEADGSWFLWAPPTIRAGSGALATKLREYRNQMCVCKDVACAEAVDKQAKDWSRSTGDEVKELPPDERKLLDELDDEMKACREKLLDADKHALVKEAIAKLEQFRDRACACADPACAEQLQKDLTDWAKAIDQQTRDVKPGPEVMTKMTEISTAIGECIAKVMAGNTAPKPPDDPMPPEDTSGGTVASGGTATNGGTAASGGTGLASVSACAEYRRQIDKMGKCPKYPRSAVDAMKQGYKQMEKSWATTSQNAAMRDGMAKSCASGADSLKKVRESMCP